MDKVVIRLEDHIPHYCNERCEYPAPTPAQKEIAVEILDM